MKSKTRFVLCITVLGLLLAGYRCAVSFAGCRRGAIEGADHHPV